MLAKRRFAASVMGFAAVLLITFFISNASAQAGSPAVHINVAPPTGSVAPRTGSVAPPTGALGYGGFSPYGGPFRPTGSTHHHHPRNNPSIAYYPHFYPVAVPYVDDGNGDQPEAQADDPEAQDGPGGSSWPPDGSTRPIYNGPMRPHGPEKQDSSITQAEADAPQETPQPATTLVFKDGHQIEVENYAIVGQTLYDLTPGHPRKVALAGLDLDATQKQNDDRGVVFQLPPSPLSKE